MDLEKLGNCYRRLDKALEFDGDFQDMYDNLSETVLDVMNDLLIVIRSENDEVSPKLTRKEKKMVKKALDYYGDILADTIGYSAGEKYWDLINKFQNKRKDT